MKKKKYFTYEERLGIAKAYYKLFSKIDELRNINNLLQNEKLNMELDLMEKIKKIGYEFYDIECEISHCFIDRREANEIRCWELILEFNNINTIGCIIRSDILTQGVGGPVRSYDDMVLCLKKWMPYIDKLLKKFYKGYARYVRKNLKPCEKRTYLDNEVRVPNRSGYVKRTLAGAVGAASIAGSTLALTNIDQKKDLLFKKEYLLAYKKEDYILGFSISDIDLGAESDYTHCNYFDNEVDSYETLDNNNCYELVLEKKKI